MRIGDYNEHWNSRVKVDWDGKSPITFVNGYKILHNIKELLNFIDDYLYTDQDIKNMRLIQCEYRLGDNDGDPIVAVPTGKAININSVIKLIKENSLKDKYFTSETSSLKYYEYTNEELVQQVNDLIGENSRLQVGLYNILKTSAFNDCTCCQQMLSLARKTVDDRRTL